MAKKINLEDLIQMLENPNIDDHDLKPYLKTENSTEYGQSGAGKNMYPVLIPNEYVEGELVEGQGTQAKLGLGFLNTIYRKRRLNRFRSEVANNVGKPILLAEGDSWFEYPVWLTDIIDYLSDNYSIYCLSAAGDELQGMVAEPEYKKHLDKLINKQGLEVQGILLSGGGNDIVGETLYDMLHNNRSDSATESLINKAAFKRKFQDIHGYYTEAIEFISETYPEIPIFIHGYDHANPLPDQGFSIPPRDGWLGKWMRKRGIHDENTQQEIVRILIDDFCSSQNQLATSHDMVTFIDCRGLVGDQWFDELHPNDKGFDIVARKFHSTLLEAGIG